MRGLGARLDYAFSIEPLHERMLRAALLRDGRAGERWRAIRREIDLDTFWDGKALDFLPLVYRALADEGVDDPDLPRLRGVHRRTWYANQLRFRRLAPALDALEAAGIETLVLKGVALATRTYPDVGLRPMTDADVLVKPDRIEHVIAVLEDQGWCPQGRLPKECVRGHAIDLRDPDGQGLDLHWHVSDWLAPAGRESTAEATLWARAVPLEVAGASTRCLDPADALLHVMLHGSNGGWRCAPQWVPDGVMIVGDGTGIDWEHLVEVTLDHNLAYPMRRCLTYLIDVFGCPVPAEVVTQLAVPTASRSTRMFARSGLGLNPTEAEVRFLGPAAGSYRYWVRQSAPLTRRQAASAFPGWLADHWAVDSVYRLPTEIGRRVVRRARVSTRRGP